MPKTKTSQSSKTTSTKKETSVLSKKDEVKRELLPKDVDDSQYITVRNGFQGQLVYKSRKTGELYIWSEFGDEQEIELRELKNAKNSSKDFFVNNWFMFNDSWVVDYLGVRQYYKNAITIDEFDSLFSLPASELKKALLEMTDGQKKSVAYRATELITDKKIDSISTIDTLEEVLNVELIER